MTKEIWEWCRRWQDLAQRCTYSWKTKNLLQILNPAECKEILVEDRQGALICALKRLDFKPDINLFASRINHQLPHYVSYTPDPEAIAIDAFNLNWSNLNFYTFPPVSVIPTVLNKLTTEGAQGICVLPDWPRQPWYPRALQLLVQNPVYLKARRHLLQLPSHPEKNHPIWQRLNPLACHFSIREGLYKYALSPTAKDVLMASWREGNSKQYHTNLSKWNQYCQRGKNIDIFQPGVTKDIEFLVSLYKSSLGYSAINTARSALSSILQCFGRWSKFWRAPVRRSLHERDFLS